MNKDINLITSILLSMIVGFVCGYIFIKIQEINCDEEMKREECLVDGGWNCE